MSCFSQRTFPCSKSSSVIFCCPLRYLVWWQRLRAAEITNSFGFSDFQRLQVSHRTHQQHTQRGWSSSMGVKASGSWLTLVSAAGTDCSEFMTRMTHSHELRISARSYVHTCKWANSKNCTRHIEKRKLFGHESQFIAFFITQRLQWNRVFCAFFRICSFID